MRARNDTGKPMRWLLIQFVLLYRASLGRAFGGHCRYLPTCSQYAIDALTKYGAVRGSIKSVARIARCHPWCKGGCDPA